MGIKLSFLAICFWPLHSDHSRRSRCTCPRCQVVPTWVRSTCRIHFVHRCTFCSNLDVRLPWHPRWIVGRRYRCWVRGGSGREFELELQGKQHFEPSLRWRDQDELYGMNVILGVLFCLEGEAFGILSIHFCLLDFIQTFDQIIQHRQDRVNLLLIGLNGCIGGDFEE